ncbi:MAG: sensor histidine kinase response regulator, Cache 1, and sensory box [Gemmatimonadetes bacterium]|nr:sensor histidine kinase response regulator, Cache 1, and sensory box [Gemmatimonadota bacterium]
MPVPDSKNSLEHVERHGPLSESLRAVGSPLRAMAESLNVALVIADRDNGALYANEHMTVLTGYSADELVGRDLAELVATDRDRERLITRLRARRDGTAEKYEIEHRRKDGSIFTAAISAAPMFDEQGNVIGSVSVVEDITERHRQERALAERERRYRSLFEVTPLPTWVFDIETLRFMAVNPAAIAHYGYSEVEFLSMTLRDIRTPQEAEELERFMEREEGPPLPRRSEHKKKDGSLIQVDMVAEDFLLDGRRSRIVVAHDITGELRMRERQRTVENQLLLAQKMEAVGGLAGGVAHDFNNLLSVMLGASESIGRELPMDSVLREDVKDIREAAERGAALTRQLLSLGRKEVRAPELLDLNHVVARVSRLLFRALGPQVRTDVQRSAEPLAIVADAGQLEQVVVNLAINARDAMPNGGSLVISTGLRDIGSAEAALAGLAPGKYVTLSVQDDGVGMDAKTRARAFEPFYTTKGPHMGTGLGLSTVYGIIQQSNGGIAIESAVGEGTRVTLYLPRADMVAPTAAINAATGEHVIPRRRGRVLLVEDEPRVRAQVRRLLERCGFVVTDAPDGAEGLFQFRARAGAVDVVVSDVMMPTMGGVEMVAQLRAIAPDVPVVFVSGYTADDRELPLDDRTLFVPKPYSIDALCDAIDSLLVR